MALEELTTTLELLVPIAKAVPVLGSPVEGSLEAAVKILRFAQDVKTNKEEAQKLAQQAAQWTEELAHAIDDVKTDTAELERLRPDVTPIRDVLGAIAKAMELQTKQSLPRRLMDSSKNKEELTELRAELKGAYIRFMFSSQLRAQSALAILLTDADADKLKHLNPISSARYDSRASPPGCLAGTRQEILAQMLTWAEDPCQGFSVFWLAGLAGTGKSTIAKTFCEQLADKGTLMATFFASRNSAERRDPFNIIYTLAYELAVTDPRIRPHVLSTLRSPPDIMQRSMKEQIERLLKVPLSQALSGRSLVFVIDALDECDKVDSVEGGALIPLLSEALRSLPVKLLVTSRQERSLEAMFKSLAHIPLRLHEIASEMVEPDVRHIFKIGFDEIRRKHELTLDSWPSQEDIDSLVQLTGRFFIFAATALRYIGDINFIPIEQLQRVLTRGATLDGEAAYSQIDALYADILQTATRDESAKPNARLRQRVSDLLRTIVLVEEPLSIAALAQFMDVSELETAKAMGALAAFLFVPDTSDPAIATVQIFHPSFRDFLCDPERCCDLHFFVDTSYQHHALAHRCLGMLNQSLVRDICHLENPTRPNSKIPNLTEQLQRHVPAAVRYASVFWPVHLCAGKSPSDSICTLLLEFCRMHLFHWIELLSLLARLPAAGDHLPTVISWLRSSGVSGDGLHDGSELLNDAYRMLLAYYPPIESYALHVYESAVATMPACALFSTVKTDTAAGARLISQRQCNWTATLRILEVDRFSACLAFSPDGSQLALSPRNGEIQLWSMRTGAQLAVLELAERAKPHDETTWLELPDPRAAYSSDSSRIVSSFSSGFIVWLALWDTKTYQELAVLGYPLDSMGERGTRFLPVSFLPGSSLVVFGCDNGTIRVWDPAGNTGTLSFGGNTNSKVWAVACSPDGSKIISGLANGILRVSDSRTGAELATLEGHSDRVNSVAFSPDGAQLVSGSSDCSIRIWDMRMNEEISLLRSHSPMADVTSLSHAVTSVAFSPDGRQVVSGSRDGTVRIWDVESSKQITLLQGHHMWVFSVSFSPDGAHVASGSTDGTIRVWDIQTLPRSMEILDDSNSEPTKELAISLNGAHLVSAAGALGRVWDVQTGQETCVLDGHTGRICVIAFSPDSNGLRIVTGSLDKTVRVWSTHTGQELVRFSVNDIPSEVALSADGTRAVASLNNTTIPAWDVSTGEQLALFVGHQSKVSCVALSPDGSRVVSCSGYTTARLWDVASGDQVAKLIGGRNDNISAVAFSPDGLRVVSSSSRGLIQAWDSITGAYIARVEQPHYSVTVVAYSFERLPPFISTGRELRINCDYGDMMIHQHDSHINRFLDAYATQMIAPRIGEADSNPMGNFARSAIGWDEPTGWLFCSSVSNDPILLCWLPVERRGPAMICGRRVAVGGTGGKVTMLDLTEAIERLHNQGIV